MGSDLCLYGATIDAQGRRWFTCSHAPQQGSTYCSHHIGVVKKINRRRAAKKRGRAARKRARRG